MCIKDWNIILSTPGKQLNLMLLLAAISIIVYVVADFFQKTVVKDLYCTLTVLVIKALAVFLAIYYFIYCVILTKKIIDKHYK